MAIVLFATEAGAQNDSLPQCESQCCCNKEVALPAGVMLGHVHPKGEWMLSYRYMSMSMSGLLSGNHSYSSAEVFNTYLMAPESMQMNMNMLMAMYGVNNRLTLMAMLHYNYGHMHMQMFAEGSNHVHDGAASPASSHEMTYSGLGDTKLYAIYALLNRARHKVMLNAGISLPAGRINAVANGDILPYSMQNGSGTFDLLPGITYLYFHKKYVAALQSNANIRLGYNNRGYSWGNEVTNNAWFAYRWQKVLSSSLRLEHVASAVMIGRDAALYKYNEPASDAANYGGQRFSLFVGTAWQPSSGKFKNWQAVAEFGVPVYQYVKGIQMSNTHFVNININYIF
ncbi:MAG: hypothetical protein ACKOXB_08725 [Flavobacteriales bacterium]